MSSAALRFLDRRRAATGPRRPVRLLVVVCAVGLGACRTAGPAEPVPAAFALSPAEAEMVGRWAMDRVLDRGQDVTAVHNPAGDRYVVLRPDGTFESGGQPYGHHTGRWYFDPGHRELVLDSDLGEADDTYWIVTVDGDAMEWAGVRSATARRFRILARRVRP